MAKEYADEKKNQTLYFPHGFGIVMRDCRQLWSESMIDCAHVGLDGSERRKWAFSRTDTERRGFPEDASLAALWEKAFGAPDGGFRVLVRNGNAILVSLPSDAGPGHRALFSAGVEDHFSKEVPLI